MYTSSLTYSQANKRKILGNIHFIGRFRTNLHLNDQEIFLLNAIVHDCLKGSSKGYLNKCGIIAKTYEKWSDRTGIKARTIRRYIKKFSDLGIINKQKLNSKEHRVLKGKYPNNTTVISLNMEGFAKHNINEAYLLSYLKYDKRKVKFTKQKNKFGHTLIYNPICIYNNNYVENLSLKIDEQKKVIKVNFIKIEDQKLSSEQIKYGLDLEITCERLERSFENMKKWYMQLGYTRIDLTVCDSRWKRWLSHEFIPQDLMRIRQEKAHKRKQEAEIIQIKEFLPAKDDLTNRLKKEMANNLPRQTWSEFISPIISVEFKSPKKLSVKIPKYCSFSGKLGTVKHIARRIWPEIEFVEAC